MAWRQPDTPASNRGCGGDCPWLGPLPPHWILKHRAKELRLPLGCDRSISSLKREGKVACERSWERGKWPLEESGLMEKPTSCQAFFFKKKLTVMLRSSSLPS